MDREIGILPASERDIEERREIEKRNARDGNSGLPREEGEEEEEEEEEKEGETKKKRKKKAPGALLSGVRSRCHPHTTAVFGADPQNRTEPPSFREGTRRQRWYERGRESVRQRWAEGRWMNRARERAEVGEWRSRGGCTSIDAEKGIRCRERGTGWLCCREAAAAAAVGTENGDGKRDAVSSEDEAAGRTMRNFPAIISMGSATKTTERK